MSGGWLFGVRAGDDDGVDGVCGYGAGGVDELFVSGAGAGTGSQVGPYSGVVSATTGSGASAASGPVAAYAFDEGLGSTVTDASGNGKRWSVAGGHVDDRGEVRVCVDVQRDEFSGARRRFGVAGPDVGSDSGGVGVSHRVAVRLAGGSAEGGRLVPVACE